MDAELCSGFRKSDWKELAQRLDDNDETAWLKAIGVFERRISERFITSIDALVSADTKSDVKSAEDANAPKCIPGFSIVALCCLLIETLQSFRESLTDLAPGEGPCSFPSGKCIKSPPGTRQQFEAFLLRPAFQGAFDDEIAACFVRGIRNGILHEAETRKWVIWRDEPEGRIVEKEDDGFALNRNLFYAAIKKEFECYLEDLRHPSDDKLRNRFRKKMNELQKKA